MPFRNFAQCFEIFWAFGIAFSPLFAQTTPNISPASSPAVEVQVIQPKQGDLKKDKPAIPPFYIWRGFNGKTPREERNQDYQKFQVYLVLENGIMKKTKPLGQTYEEFIDERANYLNSRHRSEIKEWKSLDGKWSCFIDDFNGGIFRLNNNVTGEQSTFKRPSSESCFPIQWNSKRDYFYFEVIQGDSTSRSESLWQFDPDKKLFVQIAGIGGGFNFNPDGKWIVWCEGSGDQVGTILHVYDVENNVDFPFPSETSYNNFYKWKP